MCSRIASARFFFFVEVSSFVSRSKDSRIVVANLRGNAMDASCERVDELRRRRRRLDRGLKFPLLDV